jgi:chlorobactene glucosyltransferase
MISGLIVRYLFSSLDQWGILLFFTALGLITLVNLFGMRRLKLRTSQDRPFVSVLVPARNEAENIELCLRSLLAQQDAEYEIIVLDDESTDGTGGILARLEAESPRLKVLHGQPLPEDWLGKNWACHQLAQAARGEILLFLDADTRHHPRMLADAVALAGKARLDFFSGIPRQETRTWAERLAVPMLPWMEHTLVPMPLLRWLPLPFLATAVGQFMLFRRFAYEKIGGHAAVRQEVVEDFALSRRVKQFNLRWDLIDISPRVTTRMYHNAREVWDGFSKNLFAAFGTNLLLFAFVWLWMLFATFFPWIGLALLAFGHPFQGFSPVLAVATILVNTAIWLASDLRFGLSPLQALYSPLTVLAFVFIGARSVYRHLIRRPVAWKERPARLEK